jgi:hypothetical protein
MRPGIVMSLDGLGSARRAKPKKRLVSCVDVRPAGLGPREVCFCRKTGEVTSNRSVRKR